MCWMMPHSNKGSLVERSLCAHVLQNALLEVDDKTGSFDGGSMLMRGTSVSVGEGTIVTREISFWRECTRCDSEILSIKLPRVEWMKDAKKFIEPCKLSSEWLWRANINARRRKYQVQESSKSNGGSP